MFEKIIATRPSGVLKNKLTRSKDQDKTTGFLARNETVI